MDSGNIKLLTDSALVKALRDCVGKLGYDFLSDNASKGTYAEQLVTALDEIIEDEGFETPEFTLLKFSARCREGGRDGLFDLWRLAVLAALHVLKWHDRRENPGLARDHKVTPPVINELTDYYKKLRAYEPVLYGSHQWYRDHFAHVLRVWMLGVMVAFSLEGGEEIEPPRLTGKSDLDRKAFALEERIAVFTVAALTHDMGYPLEKLAELNFAVADLLEAFGAVDWQKLKLAFTFPQHQVAQDLLRQISSKPEYRKGGSELSAMEAQNNVRCLLDKYQEAKSASDLKDIHDRKDFDWGVVFRCQWKYHQKYGRSLEKSEHGFLSALLLQRKVLYFREGEFSLEEDHDFILEEARQFMLRREILRAVASHTCQDIYFLSPVSAEALLFFCDEIQDWARPTFSQLYRGDRGIASPVVELRAFTCSRVSWIVEVQNPDMPAFVWKALSTGSSLYTRLRSAPDSRSRKFSVEWTLQSKGNKLPLEANFVFDKDQAEARQFRFGVTNSENGKAVELVDSLGDILTGRTSLDEAKKGLERDLRALLVSR